MKHAGSVRSHKKRPSAARAANFDPSIWRARVFSTAVTKRIAALIALSLVTRALGVGQPALTIYNQNSSVVRDTVPLDLKQGGTDVRFTGTTVHL